MSCWATLLLLLEALPDLFTCLFLRLYSLLFFGLLGFFGFFLRGSLILNVLWIYWCLYLVYYVHISFFFFCSVFFFFCSASVSFTVQRLNVTDLINNFYLLFFIYITFIFLSIIPVWTYLQRSFTSFFYTVISRLTFTV